MKKLRILPQPDDVTCGPTCLHAIYDFYGDKLPLEQVITEVRYLPDGGTLGVYLGLHALARGYDVTLNVINLEVFDPTWFDQKADLVAKLKEQMQHKPSQRIMLASQAFIEFIEQGGHLASRDINSPLLKKAFEDRNPILAGLSATYLYHCAREITVGNRSYWDDIKGVPSGHFVVLNGYHPKDHKIIVADPYDGNPALLGRYYHVRVSRLINAIMLGALTYDTNLLFIKPKPKTKL